MLIKSVLSGLIAATILAAAGGDARVSEAAKNGDSDALLSFLKNNADVNGTQGDGTTALHWAAYRDDVSMGRMLVEAGADVNAQTRMGGITPLFMACKNGSAAMVDLLLKAGADAKSADSLGTTPLMIAAASGSVDVLRILIEHGADVNAKEKANGETALMFAAGMNRSGAISFLLARGAEVNVATTTRMLKKPLPDDEPGNPVPRAPKPQKEGPSANKTAAAPARELGTPVMGGMTALLIAARDGEFDAVRALVNGKANVNAINAEKTSVMTEAIINGHLDIAKFLLDHNADPKLANMDGLTPLYATIDMRWPPHTWYPQPSIEQEKTNYLDLMNELLDHGADPNARLTKKLWFRESHIQNDWVDTNGATPFWRAAQANDVEAMKLLVSGGADPYIPTVQKCFPLIVASGYGFEYSFSTVMPDSRLAAVTYLVDDLFSDVNARDENGYTAMHGAAYVGANDVINFLVSRGADPKIKAAARLGGNAITIVPGRAGDSIADMANGPRQHSQVHLDTVALLEKLGSINSHDCRSDMCSVKGTSSNLGVTRKTAEPHSDENVHTSADKPPIR